MKALSILLTSVLFGLAAAAQAPQNSGASEALPPVMHFCAFNCMTLTLKNGRYITTAADGTTVTGIWTVESFLPESVIIHRRDANGFAAVFRGQISKDGGRLINVTMNGAPVSGALFAWGNALNSVPGSNAERDQRNRQIPQTPSSPAPASTAAPSQTTAQAPPSSSTVAALPPVMHFCAFNCMTLTLKNGQYITTAPDGATVTVNWTVESFSADSVIIHRKDSTGFTAVFRGRISNDGSWLSNVTMNGAPAPGALFTWGNALNSIPGSNAERDKRIRQASQTYSPSAEASGAASSPPAAPAHGSGTSAALPPVIHFCALKCMTLTLNKGQYMTTTPDGTVTWTVESFSPDSVVIHWRDSKGYTGVFKGQIAKDGGRLINVTMNDAPASVASFAWGNALDSIPGSDAERDHWGDIQGAKCLRPEFANEMTVFHPDTQKRDYFYPLLAQRYYDGGYYQTARCLIEATSGDPISRELLAMMRAQHLGDEYMKEADANKRQSLLYGEQQRRMEYLVNLKPLSKDEAELDVLAAASAIMLDVLFGAAEQGLIHAGDHPANGGFCSKGVCYIPKSPQP